MLIVRHTYFRILEMLRQPSYLVSTVLFPSLFFWFFAIPNATDPGRAQLLMGSFAAFGVIGVVLFQFSVLIANEKSSPWNSYLRTLPIPAHVSFVSLLISGIFFSVMTVGGVLITTHLSVTVALPGERWLPFFCALFLGGLPFAFFGFFLGFAARSRNILPIANLVYLPLSFAGGLWIPPHGLPKIVQDISPYLPSRMFAEIVWATLAASELKSQNIFGLLGYLILFIFLSVYFFKRDEGQKF